MNIPKFPQPHLVLGQVIPVTLSSSAPTITRSNPVQIQPHARPVDSVKSASAQEIVNLFKWLGFTDPLGHPLTQCQDFLDLVDRATSP